MDDPAEFSTDGCLVGLIQMFGALPLWRWADQEWRTYADAVAAEDAERFDQLLTALREGRAGR